MSRHGNRMEDMASELLNPSNAPGRGHPRPAPAAPPPLRVVPDGEARGNLNTPPEGRWFDLGRRGRTWIRTEAGPAGAPTLLMLHGLGATGGLNWAGSQLFLRDRFNIVTIDHRGHGRGIRTREFHLEDAADDAAAVVEALGIDRPIAVGYSMGGPIASLLWRRHRGLVSGLVFCATSRNFGGTPGEKMAFGAMGVAGLSPVLLPERLLRVVGSTVGSVPKAVLVPGPQRVKDVLWAAEEMAGHDPRSILQAAGAVGRFDSTDWIGGVDVPTSVVVTTGDQVVPAIRQFRLARAIPQATVQCVDAGHLCVRGGQPKVLFLEALRRACIDVAG